MIKLPIAVLLLLFCSLEFTQAMASTTLCCICQTGTDPKLQAPFFKKGCKRWLNEQKDCTFKDTQKYTLLELSLPRECHSGILRLGYVGHWRNSYHTEDQINQSLIPTALRHKISIEVDNTACSALEKPDYVQSALNQARLLDGQYIQIKGNQTISIGMWGIFPESANLTAVADSRITEPIYPSCTNYENKGCVGKYQADKTGYCQAKKELRMLTCKKIKSDYRWIANLETGKFE